eukprot:scaffold221_cov249-Pinguiococcus_pyrenoidosus.AAC.7
MPSSSLSLSCPMAFPVSKGSGEASKDVASPHAPAAALKRLVSTVRYGFVLAACVASEPSQALLLHHVGDVDENNAEQEEDSGDDNHDHDDLLERAEKLASFPIFTKGKKVFEHLETIYRQYEVRRDPETDDLWITIERVATDRLDFPAMVVNLRDVEEAVSNAELVPTHSEFKLRPDQRLKVQREDPLRRSVVKFLQKRVKVLPTEDGLQPALVNFHAYDLVELPNDADLQKMPRASRRRSSVFDALEGQTIDHGHQRYYVAKQLGLGVASAAFLVRDRQRRSLVLKRACRDEGEDDVQVLLAIRRSLNEATLLCGLRDVHLPRLLGVLCTEEPLCDTVWSCASGDTLQALIRGDGRACSGRLYDLGYDEVKPMILGVAFQIAAALHYLHSQHIIHNDLTPSNILVNMDTRAVRLVALDLAVRGEVKGGRLYGALPTELNRAYYSSPELLDAQDQEMDMLDAASDDSFMFTGTKMSISSSDMWAWMKIVAELFEGQPLSNTVNLRERLETLSHGHEGAEDWSIAQVVDWAKKNLQMPDRDVETFVRRGKVDGKKLVRITTANFERFITELPTGNTGNEMKKTIWTILVKCGNFFQMRRQLLASVKSFAI